jgi:hypothetical protein
MNDPHDLVVLIGRIERAEQEVSDLCSGKRRWTMTVPAEPDRDSDFVIGGALADARKALTAEYKRLTSEPVGETA